MDPYWLQIARAELRRGVYEIPGPESLARIEEYQATCTWKHSNDSIPWCSSFVNWCIEGGDHTLDLVLGETGVWEVGTKSARARSWLEWGVHVSMKHIPIGAILILKRGPEPQPDRRFLDAKGHVCFFDGWATPNHLIGLGGNQSNMVRASIYPMSKLLDARWAE